MKSASGVCLLVMVVGCSVPAFTGHRMDARAETSDVGDDAPADTLDSGVDATDAISAPDVVDAVTTEVAPDVDASAPADAPQEAGPGDAPRDAPTEVAVDAPMDVAGDLPVDAPMDIGCPDGGTRCGGACVATEADPTNCGACGRACPGIRVCVRGACVVATATLSAGNRHTCARRPDGSARCWGANMFGELGACNLAVSRIAAPVMMLNNVTGISAGARHTCALRATGEVSCWGDDESGQLGNSAMARTQMCPVGVTGLTDVVQIAAGGEHTCALQASGAVSCWGAGTVGQLGRGSTEGSAVPVAVAGTINAVAIDAGGGHTCAVRGSGEVVCWGSNRSGQVGSASESNLTTPFAVADLTDVVQVSLGQEHSCALRRSGRVVCWGRGEGGQLGDGMATNRSAANVDVVGLVDAAEISMGDNHGCARRATGAVVCWGAGASGQLGNGTTTASQRSPVIVMGLTDATELAGGAEHHCARSASRGVVCWGNNMGGQLGNNSVADSAIPVQVMGL